MEQLIDNKALEKAVMKYSGMIIRIAFNYTKNKADSEDIAQEVFYLLIKRPPFEEENYLKAWLIRVAINKSKDFVKSARHRRTIALKKDYPFIEEDNLVLRALDSLCENDRNILYLFYYEGYSAKEIGEILKKKEGAITMILTRARRKIKSYLE